MSHEIRELALFKNVFTNHSNNILQYLHKHEIDCLKHTNKYINDICECHLLLSESMNSLSDLFSSLLVKTSDASKEHVSENKGKKSKFREKYNFNKSIDEYYKDSYIYEKRVQSARKVQK
jgi:hypothetical protein